MSGTSTDDSYFTDFIELSSDEDTANLDFLDDAPFGLEYSPERSPEPAPRVRAVGRARRGRRSSTAGTPEAPGPSRATPPTRGRGRGRGRQSGGSSRTVLVPEEPVAGPLVQNVEQPVDNVVMMQPVVEPRENSSPPAKKFKLENEVIISVETHDNDGGCPICYEDYENAGNHRLVCLKCGHLFGKSCIERWIKTERNGSCPTCKSKAVMSDIRPIFGQCLKSADTAELNELRNHLKNAIMENQVLQVRLVKAEADLEEALKTISAYNELNTVKDKAFKLVVKRLPMNTQLARGNVVRVVSAPPGADFVVCGCQLVTHNIKDFGVAKIEASSVKKIPLHSQIVRAVHVNPVDSHLIASTSDDSTLVISDVSLHANNVRIQHKLPSHGWACCWMSVNQVAVGLKNGRVLRITTGKLDDEDLTEGVGEKPIIALSYDSNHRVLMICSSNSVRAYRNGVVYNLLSNVSLASFHYDSASSCFIITIPPVQGKVRTVLQVYKVNFSAMGTVKLIGNYQTASNKMSKNTVNIIWSAPTGQLLCAFFDEDHHFTSILNWGKPDNCNPDVNPAHLITIKHKLDEHIVHYAQAERQAPPSPLAPNGLQNTLFMVTPTNMTCYCLIYS